MDPNPLTSIAQHWAPISFVVWSIAQAALTMFTVRRHEKDIETNRENISKLRERVSRLEGRINGRGYER